jgi:hypothetical protein
MLLLFLALTLDFGGCLLVLNFLPNLDGNFAGGLGGGNTETEGAIEFGDRRWVFAQFRMSDTPLLVRPAQERSIVNDKIGCGTIDNVAKIGDGGMVFLDLDVGDTAIEVGEDIFLQSDRVVEVNDTRTVGSRSIVLDRPLITAICQIDRLINSQLSEGTIQPIDIIAIVDTERS